MSGAEAGNSPASSIVLWPTQRTLAWASGVARPPPSRGPECSSDMDTDTGVQGTGDRTGAAHTAAAPGRGGVQLTTSHIASVAPPTEWWTTGARSTVHPAGGGGSPSGGQKKKCVHRHPASVKTQPASSPVSRKRGPSTPPEPSCKPEPSGAGRRDTPAAPGGSIGGTPSRTGPQTPPPPAAQSRGRPSSTGGAPVPMSRTGAGEGGPRTGPPSGRR